MQSQTATLHQVLTMIAEANRHPARFDAYEVHPVLESWTGSNSDMTCETFETIAEATQTYASDENTPDMKRILWTLYGVRSGIAEAIADRETEADAFALLHAIAGLEGIPGQTRYNVAEPVAIITVSGGVCDIGTNPGGYPITIVDFDNLKESIGADEELRLDGHAQTYIKRTDPDLWNKCQPLLSLDD